MPPSGRYLKRGDVLSWGRVGRQPQYVARPNFRDELPKLISEPGWESKLAIGLRRSYGDSCLNGAGALIDITGLDRFISFDPQSGRLKAEAGISLSRLLRVIVPRGWFLPTTPGTRLVTLGGAVANDVHGKNHHRAGTFGSNVIGLGLLRSDGRRLTLSARIEPELFCATIGGLGLTGVIEWVELQLVPIRSAYLDVEILPYGSLDDFWSLAEASVGQYEHTVAWIDCMSRGARAGRGVFTRANWAKDDQLDVKENRVAQTLPFEFPTFPLKRLSAAAFNEFYYSAASAQKEETPATPFSLFLSARRDRQLESALRIGRTVAVPVRHSVGRRTSRRAGPPRRDCTLGQASFLAVIKTFGDRPSPGMLSFPRAGATLALDFPNRGDETLSLMRRLDEIVHGAGGALYPAKDGRMSATMFRSAYPRWEAFAAHKDPHMSSDFWRRVTQNDRIRPSEWRSSAQPRQSRRPRRKSGRRAARA